MPVPIPDYEGEFVKAIRKNLKNAIKQLDSNERNMVEKINTFISHFDFPEDKVREKIRKDRMFRAKFAINPGRQSIHQKLAASFIKKLPGVKKFKTLSNTNLQLLSGGVITRAQVREMGATRRAKTIDFEWETNGKKVYASHKHTGVSGGGQDNQYDDLQDFIREANDSHLPSTIFLAIADGNYYLTNDSYSRTTKLQTLKNLANRRNVFTVSSGELEEFIKNL